MLLIGRETARTRGISTETCRTGLDHAVLLFEQPQHMSHTTESSFLVFSDVYYIYVTEETKCMYFEGLYLVCVCRCLVELYCSPEVKQRNVIACSKGKGKVYRITGHESSGME